MADPATWAVVGAAVIGAGSQIAASSMNKPRKDPKIPTVHNPRFGPSQERYLALIDNYMKSNGIPSNLSVPVPANTGPSPAAPAVGAVPAPTVANVPPPVKSAQLQRSGAEASLQGSTAGTQGVSTVSNPSGGSNADIYAAGIGAAGQLAGAAINKPPKKDLPPTMANPYYEPFQTRYDDIINNYFNEKGIPVPASAAAPIPPAVPGTGGPAPAPTPAQAATQPSRPAPTSPSGPVEPINRGLSNLFSGVAQSAQAQQNAVKPVEQTPIAEASRRFSEDDEYTKSSLAAQLGARRLGLTETPRFETTRDFYEQDQERKEAELKRLNEYIYGQRQVRR